MTRETSPSARPCESKCPGCGEPAANVAPDYEPGCGLIGIESDTLLLKCPKGYEWFWDWNARGDVRESGVVGMPGWNNNARWKDETP